MLQTQFIESKRTATAEEYNEMLGTVPPVRMTSNAFLVGEPVDHIDEYQKTSKGLVKVCRPRYDLYFVDSEGKYHYGGLTTIYGYELFLEPMYCTRCGYVEAQRREYCIECNSKMITTIKGNN